MSPRHILGLGAAGHIGKLALTLYWWNLCLWMIAQDHYV
jgi:hypothetical protein